jgi:cardiolipin synthase
MPGTQGSTRKPADSDEKIVLAQGARREAVVEVIRSARRRLVLSVFRCDDFKVMDELDDAIHRGVTVEALMTARAKGWEEKLADLEMFLGGMGAQVRRYGDPVIKYHAKYVVADDQLALVSSGNLTRKCFDLTCDFVLVTRARDVVSGLTTLFESDHRATESSLPKGISDRLIVSPQQARARFIELIEQADDNIAIIDRRITDPGILALLKAKRAKGIDVRRIDGGGVGKDMISHGRLMLIDGRTAAIGSISLDAEALDFRREVAVILRDPACVAQLRNFFDEVFQVKDVKEIAPVEFDAM